MRATRWPPTSVRSKGDPTSGLLCDEGQLQPGGAADLCEAGCGFDIVSGGELRACSPPGVTRRGWCSPASARRATRCAWRWRPACAASTSRAWPNWPALNEVAVADGPPRAGQPARQPRRRRRHPPLHLHRPEEQQVRHRARPGAWPPTGRPRRCPASKWSASTATSARRSPRSNPSWTRWTACSTWWKRWKPEASACATSTSAVAWASSTPTNSRRRPTC
jgi:hypothetical protein